MGILLTILQGTNLVASLVAPTVQAALAIKAIFAKSGTDYTAEITAFQNGALQDNQATLDAIAAWKAANGFTD